MNVRLRIVTTISICGAVAIGFTSQENSLGSSAMASNDSVVASFERELAHSPVPAAAAQRREIEDDVLYRELNSIHWTDSSTLRPDARRPNLPSR